MYTDSGFKTVNHNCDISQFLDKNISYLRSLYRGDKTMERTVSLLVNATLIVVITVMLIAHAHF